MLNFFFWKIIPWALEFVDPKIFHTYYTVLETCICVLFRFGRSAQRKEIDEDLLSNEYFKEFLVVEHYILIVNGE